MSAPTEKYVCYYAFRASTAGWPRTPLYDPESAPHPPNLFNAGEDTATTHRYVEADLAMKQAALDRVEAPNGEPARFTPDDQLLAFLEKL